MRMQRVYKMWKERAKDGMQISTRNMGWEKCKYFIWMVRDIGCGWKDDYWRESLSLLFHLNRWLSLLLKWRICRSVIKNLVNWVIVAHHRVEMSVIGRRGTKQTLLILGIEIALISKGITPKLQTVSTIIPFPVSGKNKTIKRLVSLEIEA